MWGKGGAPGEWSVAGPRPQRADLCPRTPLWTLGHLGSLRKLTIGGFVCPAGPGVSPGDLLPPPLAPTWRTLLSPLAAGHGLLSAFPGCSCPPPRPSTVPFHFVGRGWFEEGGGGHSPELDRLSRGGGEGLLDGSGASASS